METLAVVLAALVLAVLAWTLADGIAHRASLPDLSSWSGGDEPPSGAPAWPRLSVVVAARDEADHVERAMRTLLALDYPDLEIVAVDDRSGDGTGAILDRLAAESPRLRVRHVTELPRGWLGKNHALHSGAACATGELVLFTDADVHFAPRAMRRAVRFAVERGADHLTVVPDVTMPGWLLTAFTGTFAVFFGVFTKPWRAPDPRSAAHVGIGAFNLVRASFYRAHGGHEPLRLRPDDDVMLAKHLKRSGGRPLVATGPAEVSVEWYRTLGEVFRGLEKNLFAGLGYSVVRVAGATAAVLLVWVAPFVGVFVGPPLARGLWGAAAACAACLFLGANRRGRAGVVHLPGFPIGALLFVACMWRSTILALVRRGIVWRGTRYPLDELRRNEV